MRITAISAICIALLNTGCVTAMPEDMSIDRLLDICESPTIQAAITKGDKLGWPRLGDAEIEDWRTHFLSYNGGSVDVVAWKRERRPVRADSLSFWIAVGPNAHKACYYSTQEPAGLLEGLTQRLGAPDSVDKQEAIEMTVAFWRRGASDYSLAQTGSFSAISIGPSQ